MRPWSISSIFLLFVLLFLSNQILGEDEASDDAIANDDAYADDDANANDDAIDNGNDDANNDVNSIEVCSDSAIEVTGISLLCDSPGTYYYGSGKYRNNIYCKLGDKAKMTMTFEIVDELEEDINPLLTLKAEGNGESITVYQNQRLCKLGALSTLDGASCPSSGSFSLSTQFRWRKNDDETNEAFYPLVSIGFHSEKDPDVYDLGGANTEMCPGNTFWASNKFHYLSPLASLIWSVFILLGVIGLCGAIGWYLWRRSMFGPVPPSDNFDAYYNADEMKPEITDRKARLLRKNRQTLVNF
mmetsp:Transcript_30860/g.46835  ORF Transcript_30860/g.46835 Transcript_30860/m.46835 type:complete len:300 (+) Transcript_30860:177-1076(+)|eukprot:CAMPEP_0178894554 /NCGR_PEP_ID=MMETSP0786-20121207/83_1 /TAXON_ID=186022 /ORGANISM="Thalassionema frauenfeldii, Strain CCMP 1798" /LENGTH=299 /DNA_ID=CAMNT_0020564661 /DNA_START=68 /DNA_END=967 /DNA_ORIENTATION=-